MPLTMGASVQSLNTCQPLRHKPQLVELVLNNTAVLGQLGKPGVEANCGPGVWTVAEGAEGSDEVPRDRGELEVLASDPNRVGLGP